MKQVKNILLLVSALLVIVLIPSCNKDGSGEIITKTITTQGFHTLNINGPFTVYLVQDAASYVSFEGEKKRVETCKAEIGDSVLTIDGKKFGEFLHPNEMITRVFVHIDTNFKRVNVNDDCKIYTQGPLSGSEIGVVTSTRSVEGRIELNCRTFYFWNNPNGTHLELTGNVNELKIWNSGLSTIDARYLTSDYALIENGSQNECKVRCLQTLEYSLTNTGNIVYYGNPPAIVPNLTTGTGELIKGD